MCPTHRRPAPSLQESNGAYGMFRQVTSLGGALFATAFVLGSLSCGHSEPAPSSPSCSYALSSSTQTFGAQGGTGSIALTTGPACRWTARSDVSWLTLAPAEGTGSAAIAFTVAADTQAVDRRATVSVADQALTFVQEGTPACTVSVSPGTRTFDATGGSGTVDVTAGPTCSWTAAAGDPWVSIVAGAQGTGSGSVNYLVAANPGATARDTAITVAGHAAAIHQLAPVACTCVLTPSTQSLPRTGGTAIFGVQAAAQCGWTAQADVEWVRIVAPAGGHGLGSDQVQATIDANGALGSRTGSVTVADQHASVSQDGVGSCAYSVSPVERSYCWGGATADPITVSTDAGCPWTSTADSPWITVLSGLTGLGAGTVSYGVSDFTSDATRRGAILVRWPAPTAGQNVWITQGGCRYAVAPTSVTVAASGGRVQVQVFAGSTNYVCDGPTQQSTCPWSASASASWVHVVTAGHQAGDGLLVLDVNPNNTGADRSSTVLVAGQSLTVVEAR